MKTDLELIFVIDASGSMYSLTEDTIGGFNRMIETHRKTEKNVLVSTILFNGGSRVLHDRVPIEAVEPMNEQQYQAGGGTALLDALGGAIHHMGNVHKYARKEDVPEKTLVVVTTDGMENCSRIYDGEKVRRMVRHEEEKYGWEFLFLGANIDSVHTAAGLGIAPERAVNYVNDKEGNAVKYRAVSEAIDCCMRAAPLSEGTWRKEVDRDFSRRGK